MRPRRSGRALAETLLPLGATALAAAGLVAFLGYRDGEPGPDPEARLARVRDLLGQELGRASHLVARDAASGALQDPRLAAVWILEGGKGIGFRVFPAEPPRLSTGPLAPEAVPGEQVRFLFREGNLVLTRRRGPGTTETRVLLPGVTRLEFTAESRRDRDGILAGRLGLALEVEDPSGGGPRARRDSFPLRIPVLSADPGDPAFLPPLPELGR